MNFNVVIAQLRARAPIFGQRVAGSASFKVLPEAANLKTPAAYVMPLDEQPGDQQSATGYQQAVKEEFAVVVVLDNAVDERGQVAAASLHAVRLALFKALLGFQVAADHDVIAFEGGQLLHLDRARLYYQFEFSSEYAISTEDTWIPDRNAELPDFEGLDITVDTIDPFDPNLAPIGPDGTAEARLQIIFPEEP